MEKTKKIKEKFLKKISKGYPLNQEDFNLFIENSKVKNYKKGSEILSFGQIENNITVVISGIIHRTIKIDNQIFTLDISLAGTGMCSLKSYLEKSPSLETQKALSDTDILYFERETIEKLTHENHAFSYISSKFRDTIYLEKDKRLYLLQKKNACDRFEFFMNTNKNAKIYLKEVPQHIIAEYLNLTPETLSRVKKKYFKEN